MSNQGPGAEPEPISLGKAQPPSSSTEITSNEAGLDNPISPGSSSGLRRGYLPQWLSWVLRSPSRLVIIDPKFSRNSQRYVLQAGLATLAMLAILLFVDSLSQAALAAGLGSSVIILFVYPSSPTATSRSLVGGHGLALLLGSAFALLLFASPVESFLQDLSPVRNLSVAVSVGLLILAMAVTDIEHPPAAGTVLGMATRPWELETAGIIIGAVLLLAVIKYLLRSRLRDLI